MNTSNFKQDILYETKGEVIETIIIRHGRLDNFTDVDDSRDIPDFHINKQLQPEVALELLNYEYNSGFGSMDCHDILIYTAEHVYFIHEYDGSTEIRSVPRNPS